MRISLSASHLALCGLCVLGLFGCSSSGQLLTTDLSGQQAAAQPPATPTEHSNGIVMDWSTSHVVFPSVGEINALVAVQHDPRAILSWQAAEREYWHRVRGPRHFLPTNAVHRDWSISLGTGGVAPSMYPAKFGFDITATPSCANDFIVYPVNVTGGSGQPNIVAFNNLYSGTTPTAGICNRTPAFGVDDGVSATTTWSYDVHAAGGQVATSPALSLDGTKIAFVETASATTAHFHVLAWKSGDGVAANLQTVTSALTISSFTGLVEPVAGSGTASDLALVPLSGAASDTLSSPFVDYSQDTAYIGNDSGTLFRVKNVFCPPPLGCAGGGTPAPSLDASWGTGGALTTGCSGKLTGAVRDGGTGNIFVGCSDGKLYGFTSAGSALTGSPLTVGDGTTTVNGNVGGIVDPPIVDGVNGFVYVVSGSSGGSAVLVQAGTTSFTSPTPVIATLGAGGHFMLHAPSFNAAYFSGGTALIYDWALNAGDTQITLYGVGFTGHTMNAGTPPLANQLSVVGSTPVELSPTTEFLNGANDLLFVSGITAVTPNFIENNINAFPTTNVFASETGGTSGIVVDNSSVSAQASNIYFGDLGSKTAVKLTQAGLN